MTEVLQLKVGRMLNFSYLIWDSETHEAAALANEQRITCEELSVHEIAAAVDGVSRCVHRPDLCAAQPNPVQLSLVRMAHAMGYFEVARKANTEDVAKMAVVDPSFDTTAVTKELNSRNLSLRYVLLTHHHSDRRGGSLSVIMAGKNNRFVWKGT